MVVTWWIMAFLRSVTTFTNLLALSCHLKQLWITRSHILWGFGKHLPQNGILPFKSSKARISDYQQLNTFHKPVISKIWISVTNLFYFLVQHFNFLIIFPDDVQLLWYLYWTVTEKQQEHVHFCGSFPIKFEFFVRIQIVVQFILSPPSPKSLKYFKGEIWHDLRHLLSCGTPSFFFFFLIIESGTR